MRPGRPALAPAWHSAALRGAACRPALPLSTSLSPPSAPHSSGATKVKGFNSTATVVKGGFSGLIKRGNATLGAFYTIDTVRALGGPLPGASDALMPQRDVS